ncbi:tyrosine-type recombinase/integrase [Streptomyces sp. WM6378]|uniref:tyrosine-type recombinase/integrase n=1 Tax=Streptomyces sp. WM6378 TaxID=1415557 RepID=UPI0006AF120D|nr:tyrosine-type recombinase/integrase [Streptomyces sp. WM6378]KOU53611.1 integrase [Streptomyces sp. WM6378]
MPTSYNVRFWDIRERTGRRKPFEVRWAVGGREKSESYLTKPLAESRKAELITAARNGEAFDLDTRLPLSELRKQRQAVTWYEHTLKFIDMKWESTPAKSRPSLADALASITPALVKTEAGRHDHRVLRRALYSWAYNKKAREQEPCKEWREALDWIKKHSISVTDLEDPLVLRKALHALSTTLDGKPAAARTARRKKVCFNQTLTYAAESKLFSTLNNPLDSLSWKPPRTSEEVDPESVANPRQVRELLRAVREQGRRGETLEAFFGCMYHAAMRPSEVKNLRVQQCHLPEKGWGTLTLRNGLVRVGKEWTDDGTAHDQRSLKWRAPNESRPVPIPPVFVQMLRKHITAHGTAKDGRVFQTLRGGVVQESGYGEVWAEARKKALPQADQESLLAKRPYDLRHAGISFWLSSGVDPAESARRAGHSLAVMFRIYAKVLAQSQGRANKRIEAALEEWGGSTET